VPAGALGFGFGVGFDEGDVEGDADGDDEGAGCGPDGFGGCVEPIGVTGGRFSGGAVSPVGNFPHAGSTKIADTRNVSNRRILGRGG
jgi:hypothetical protein